MKIINLLFLKLVLLMIMSGCMVSKKKYDELMEKKLRLDNEIADCNDSLLSCEARKELLQEKLDDCLERKKSLEKDSSAMVGELETKEQQLEEQKSTTEGLRQRYKELLANCSEEASKLSDELTRKEKKLMELEDNLDQREKNINALKKELEAREQRVNELESILQEKEQAVNSLKKRINDALLGFKEQDLQVEIKNGKVYVSMSEQLLFQSGSYKVDRKGKKALRQMADVLKQTEDVQIMVEGHTDNVPVAKGTKCVDDNWDLSVLRATSIVNILVDAGVTGEKLTAAGRSKYVPLVENNSSENKKKNRRTEIILTPNLNELFDILETK